MTAPLNSALEAILRKDRLIVIGGLVAVIVVASVYLLLGAGVGMSPIEMTRAPLPGQRSMAMGSSTMSGMMQPAVWSATYALLILFMWWTMMVAMMLPSAAPTLLLFAAINRKQRERAAPYVPTAVFAAGSVVVWGGFSVCAVLLQWWLQRSGLLSARLEATNTLLGAGLLAAAGVWQLTPLKHACLRHCRSPVHYLTAHWRRGTGGALIMGLRHGVYCLGCCWFLMALLFYGGVMNLYWIAGLAAYALVEKTAPRGHWVGGVLGVVLIGWAVYLALSLV